MLEFFRRYQRYIYFVVTFFVIISFSFFGTFNVLPSLQSHTVTAFTAVNGRSIKQVDVEELAMFIGSDSADKLLLGGYWGPNFLNDGVVRKDILEPGLGNLLMEQFAPLLHEEMQVRLAKEKRYRPYQHPSAPFLNAAGSWAYFAPAINQGLQTLQSQADAASPEAFQVRTDLYLAQHQFPAPLLQQVLFYQQKQYNWLPADPELLQSDLSLFGYHSLQDWFGSKFLRLAAEFIINSAIQAEQMGYEVSRQEVLADLARNATLSYQQNQNNPRLGVTNSDEYFKQQLQRMGLDQNKAIALWRQVMLFRRLYQDQGSAPLMDRKPFEDFEKYAREDVKGTLYTLPQDLQLADFKALQRLQTYLAAVAPPAPSDNPLALPKEFFTAEMIAAKQPELVEKRYVLEIAEVDKKALIGQVSTQAMWDWQVSDSAWQQLQALFPVLGTQEATTAEKRQAALDALDNQTRQRINHIARLAVTDQHPEWIDEALAAATPARREVGLPVQGSTTALSGVADTKPLIALLDAAPLVDTSQGEDSPPPVAVDLQRYSGDGTTYYRIAVLERKGSHVLTFGAAVASGALERAIEADFKSYYESTRLQDQSKYIQVDGTWKPFELVREQIAEERYKPVLVAIRQEAEKLGILATGEPPLTNDRAATLRMLQPVHEAFAQVKTGQTEGVARPQDNDSTTLALTQQWELISQPFEETRANSVPAVDRDVAFTLPPQEWSNLVTPPNGAMSFFQVTSKGYGAIEEAVRERTNAAHMLLSHAAKRQLGSYLLAAMVDKGAINLDFMERPSDIPEMSPEIPSEA